MRKTAAQLSIGRLLASGVLEEVKGTQQYIIRHDIAATTTALAKPAAKPKIEFDADNRCWHNITRADFDSWREAYPAINVSLELKQAGCWLLANPANRKSNYAKFITNWLKRAQDRAPATGTRLSVVRPTGPNVRDIGRHAVARAMLAGGDD